MVFAADASNGTESLSHFSRATLYATGVCRGRVSVRPCVRYKPVYTVKKRINMSCKQRRTVAQEVYSFLLPNILVKFR